MARFSGWSCSTLPGMEKPREHLGPHWEIAAELTVLLMLASSFPLNSTMEYTAPFTSFSATVCSFPEGERELSVTQSVCSAHIQRVKRFSVNRRPHHQDHSEVENDVGKGGGEMHVRHTGWKTQNWRAAGHGEDYSKSMQCTLRRTARGTGGEKIKKRGEHE